MTLITRFAIAFFSIPLIFVSLCAGQESPPSPKPSPVAVETPPRQSPDTIRTTVEEVQLTVTSLDSSGRLDPTMELADVLVLEDGVAQELRSVRRIPARVLLLLDTGGEINSVKRVRLTREIANRLVAKLAPGDEISVMQFNNKVELLQNWTIDKAAVQSTLATRMFSGKRARFLDALIAAAAHFKDRPQGNRHVVMITDGVQGAGVRVDREAAFGKLRASNAVVHVISYTTISKQATAHARRYKRNRDKSPVPDEAIDSLPRTPDNEALRRAHEPGGFIIDLDRDRRKAIKEYEAAMRMSERDLALLSEESGGRIWLPESADEMVDNGEEAARLIDSQYVVTYKPQRALASGHPGEVRRIDVTSRRVGLKLISRRQYVVPEVESAPDRARKVEQ